jgi:hypothetical protein
MKSARPATTSGTAANARISVVPGTVTLTATVSSPGFSGSYW